MMRRLVFDRRRNVLTGIPSWNVLTGYTILKSRRNLLTGIKAEKAPKVEERKAKSNK